MCLFGHLIPPETPVLIELARNGPILAHPDPPEGLPNCPPCERKPQFLSRKSKFKYNVSFSTWTQAPIATVTICLRYGCPTTYWSFLAPPERTERRAQKTKVPHGVRRSGPWQGSRLGTREDSTPIASSRPQINGFVPFSRLR